MLTTKMETDQTSVMESHHTAIERVARDSYGRLLAFLTARVHDVSAAEDALADAFEAALEAWPRTGVPEKPEAWLLVAARRKLIDAARRDRVHSEHATMLRVVAEEAESRATGETAFPDERLQLLFVCAHPAIDASIRTPLMLQVVLKVDAARIASAFLLQPAAMGQRLSRAKAKIRDARIRFETPESGELAERLGTVLDTIYAAYGTGWDDVAGSDPRRQGLAAEALELGQLLLQFMPDEPEALGLMALMLHCEARREARRTECGEYVPLLQQDVGRWSLPMIEAAERHLAAAARFRRMGRFQLEAAIQSAHAQRRASGATDWEAIAILYEGLVQVCPAPGAFVARAAAVGEARGAASGWALLETLPAADVKSYQPYWALSAHLLERLGRREEADAAYSRAIGLCQDASLRAFLLERARNAAGNS